MLFKKAHLTTDHGHRVVARRQGYGVAKVTISLYDGENPLPRYGGVEMPSWEAQALIEAIQAAMEAV